MKKLLLLSVVSVSVVPSVVIAQEDIAFGDQDMPVVLSATRLKQAIADAPASITLIDRQMIDQSGAREIPDLLRLVPGMVV
ncbi:MAG: TonB-dependent receptor, partial [Pseudomonadales bacterium]|nr:TonB-dependent receptor [Pseudomonadales bacterium]